MLEAARVCLGLKLTDRWSTLQLLKTMNWLTLEQYLLTTSSRIVHSIIHKSRPVLLAHKMKPSSQTPEKETRLSGKYKLGSRPAHIGRTQITKYHFKAKSFHFWAQIPDSIQSIPLPHLFKKWLKRWVRDPKDLPPVPKCQYVNLLRIWQVWTTLIWWNKEITYSS